MNTISLKILVADDHKLFSSALRTTLLGHYINSEIDTCENGQEAVLKCRKRNYDLVLMDMEMPILNGYTSSEIILKECSQTKILLLTMTNSKTLEEKIISIGVSGIFYKHADLSDLTKKIDEVLSLGSKQEDTLTLSRKKKDKFQLRAKNILSSREIEVLSHILLGFKNKKIGEILSISPLTVKTHRAAIMRKLIVKNSAELYSKWFSS
jgi:DNA-binding NarL/FixJ family response regulator